LFRISPAPLRPRAAADRMPPLSTDLFDYDLPARLIAQTPAARRDASRLLVVHRSERRLEHRVFTDLGDYLRPGDTLFRNNAAVLPARLLASRPSGGAVECLLLRPAAPRPGEVDPGDEWWCLLRPGKKLPVDAAFGITGVFTGTVLEKDAEGAARVAFACAPAPDGAPTDIVAVANRCGEVPLPPYIERQHTPEERAADLERYQTVYADRARQVAAAAPTAGLHFTPELLARLASAGVRSADLTLHVGLGTFKPIATASVEEHAIHREIYEVPPATQAATLAPAPGSRRIAVGTTSVRTLEDFSRKHAAAGSPQLSGRPVRDEAAIYLYPPTRFAAVDALVTNFHQPRSTLLCLVSAFLAPGSTDGIAWLKEIYAEAIAREYRFFSYGDAMLIL
jgi:S-adenosylmethionine:tRNA ribosyltransferase-isomerase